MADTLKKSLSSLEGIAIFLLIFSSLFFSVGIALSNAVVCMISAFIIFISIILVIVWLYKGD